MLQAQGVPELVNDGQEESVRIAGLLLDGQIAAQLQLGAQDRHEAGAFGQVADILRRGRESLREQPRGHVVVKHDVDSGSRLRRRSKGLEPAEAQANIRGLDAVPGFRRQPDLAHQRIVVVAIHQLPGRLVGNEIRNRLIRQRAQIELRGICLEGSRAAGKVDPVVVSGGDRGERKKQSRQDGNPCDRLEPAIYLGSHLAPFCQRLANARPQILELHAHRTVIHGKPGSVEHELGGGGPLNHRDHFRLPSPPPKP